MVINHLLIRMILQVVRSSKQKKNTPETQAAAEISPARHRWRGETILRGPGEEMSGFYFGRDDDDDSDN